MVSEWSADSLRLVCVGPQARYQRGRPGVDWSTEFVGEEWEDNTSERRAQGRRKEGERKAKGKWDDRELSAVKIITLHLASHL